VYKKFQKENIPAPKLYCWLHMGGFGSFHLLVCTILSIYWRNRRFCMGESLHL